MRQGELGHPAEIHIQLNVLLYNSFTATLLLLYYCLTADMPEGALGHPVKIHIQLNLLRLVRGREG
jgi:hypothetical protein